MLSGDNELFETTKRQEDKFPSRDSRVWQDSQERYKTITVDYIVTADDDILLCDTSSGSIDITLAASISRRKLTIIKTDGDDIVTVSPVSGETIDNNLSLTITDPYKPIQLKAVDNGYIIISGGADNGDFINIVDYGAVGDNTTDNTTSIQNALDTGKDVYLPSGLYKHTTALSITTSHQRVFGPGILVTHGAIDGVVVSGSSVGVELDLTFNSPNQSSGYAVKIDIASRVKINKLYILDAFGGLYVTVANTVSIIFMWGVLRGPGVVWYGDDTHRSDILHLGMVVVDPGTGYYGLDWNGNCHSLEVKYLGIVGGKGGIIRNTAGTTTFPAIGRFNHIEIDYSETHSFDIQAGLDYDFIAPYLFGATGSGLYIAATINNYQVRVNGGKSTGHTRYGIENAGGVVLFGGATDLTSNTLGEILGNVWTMTPRLNIDGTFYLTTSSGNPIWVLDANDYAGYDRSSNTMANYIGGVSILTWNADRISAGKATRMANYTVANLPATHLAGDVVFATNGRKAGEGAGSGTGVMAYSDGTNWINCDHDAVVSA